MPPVTEITPAKAHARLNDSNKTLLIDVLQPEEFALAHLAFGELIPMSLIRRELARLKKLATEHDLLVLCHHGVRSLLVVSWLREQGLENCYSVAGGIDRWSLEVDRNIRRY